jgi:copper(I)-binding protein
VNRALRAATMGVLLLSPVALSACSAGQVTQTATQDRDKTGSQAKVGDITLRAVELEYPRGGTYQAGDDAALQMAIVNTGSTTDTLTAVEGKGFASAEITGASATATATAAAGGTATATATAGGTGTAGATATPGGSATATPGASATATPGASATGTAGPTGTTAAGGTGTSGASGTIEIPAGSAVYVGENGVKVQLIGLTESLTTGQRLELTLTFENAGDITVNVSVANPNRALSRGDGFNFHQSNGEASGGQDGPG